MRFVLLFCFALLSLSTIAQKKRVWVDTDIMIGKFGQDVDDGLALLMLLADSTVQIEGISFIGKVDYGQSIAHRLIENYALGQNIPLFKGAKNSSQFLEQTDAVKGLVEALKKGPLVIFALGPMTNIASVLHLHPELVDNIEQVAFCGGRRPGQVFRVTEKGSIFSDYNFDLDPKSAEQVLKSKVPIHLAGYDCADNIFLSKKDYLHLKESEKKMDRWLYRKLNNWRNLWKMFVGSKQGFIPFDCATVSSLLYPSDFELEQAIPAYIKERENDTKNTVKTKTKPYLEVDKNNVGINVSYCSEAKNHFKVRLLKAIGHPAYQVSIEK